MPSEKQFETVLAKYPELIEDGLRLLGRQITLHGSRMDLLFEDGLRRQLIVELKWGPIKDAHIGQILRYQGLLLSSEDPTLRVMLIGNRVPPSLARTLDHYGISWKEISGRHIALFLRSKKDDDLAASFEEPAAPDFRHRPSGEGTLTTSDQADVQSPPIELQTSGDGDGDTRRTFTDEERLILAALRRDLGPNPLRTGVRKWFQQQTPRREYGPRWIVCNRYIVTNNPNGRGAICILDLEKMPEHPFPRVMDRISAPRKRVN